MKITAIIQARMGSTRLPGKILMKLNNTTVLDSVIEQLRYSKELDHKIIATTSNLEDDVIEQFARSHSMDFFRGDSLNVLDRYYRCAKKFSLEHIVRITADCPIIDPTIVDKTILFYKNNKFDYVNNFLTRTFPSGVDVEVFSFTTLQKAWKEAITLYDKEHVTPYIYNNEHKFKVGTINYTSNLSHLHLSVDTKQDLDLLRLIHKKINKKPIMLEDILKLFEDEPSLIEINKKLE